MFLACTGCMYSIDAGELWQASFGINMHKCIKCGGRSLFWAQKSPLSGGLSIVRGVGSAAILGRVRISFYRLCSLIRLNGCSHEFVQDFENQIRLGLVQDRLS